MINLIPVNTTEASSADFTVTKDTPVTLFLIDANGFAIHARAKALLQIKASNGTYTTVGQLTATSPVLVVSAPGTWRVTRLANEVGFGVDRS